jgi:hypothetical protein
MSGVGGIASAPLTHLAGLICPFHHRVLSAGGTPTPGLAASRCQCPPQCCFLTAQRLASLLCAMAESVWCISSFGLRCMAVRGRDADHQIETLRPVLSLEPPGGIPKPWRSSCRLPSLWKPLSDALMLEGAGIGMHLDRASPVGGHAAGWPVLLGFPRGDRGPAAAAPPARCGEALQLRPVAPPGSAPS